VVDNTASRWEPESDEEYEAASTELRRRFVAWATRGDAVFTPDAPEGMLHYKWGYLDGHLTRWRGRDLDEIYLEIYPAKVMAEPDERLEMGVGAGTVYRPYDTIPNTRNVRQMRLVDLPMRKRP